MELWFVYSLLSVVTIGLYTFTHRVSAARGYDGSFVTTFGSAATITLLLSASLLRGEQWETPDNMLLLAGVGGVVFIIGITFRVEALKHIDATIALPIHKVIGPALAILIGVSFFAESFSVSEWFGLILSICIPILLISRSESSRQSNMQLGLFYIVASALLGTIVIAINKIGVDLFESILLYGALGNIFAAGFGVIRCCQARKLKLFFQVCCEKEFLWLLIPGSVLQFLGFLFLLYAFDAGGPLGVVATVNSLYILIPIILSIIFYGEHWNARKVIAIILSIAAVGLLG